MPRFRCVSLSHHTDAWNVRRLLSLASSVDFGVVDLTPSAPPCSASVPQVHVPTCRLWERCRLGKDRGGNEDRVGKVMGTEL